MTRINLWGTLLSLSLLSSSIVKAQSADTAKVRLAVLPFVSAPGAQITNSGDVQTIQELVTAEFTSLSRFMVLDRSKFQKIIDELHIQSSEQFLNGQIVEQGKMIGAKYLVTGVVNEYKATRSDRPAPTLSNPTRRITAFAGSLKISFQVIDVETGQSMFVNPINVAPNDLVSMADSATAMQTSLTKMKGEVNKQIKLILAGQMQILAVGTPDKDGLPKTVLTNGGGDIIKPGDKTRLTVSTIQKVGTLIRHIQLAELSHPKVENEVVEWEVNHKEAKALNDAITAKTVLVLTVDNNHKGLFD